MAFSFVVETGSGSATATSYVALADAEQYVDNLGDHTLWDAETDNNKQLALMQGTRFLDAKYGTNWRGTKGSSTQALNWPRADVLDPDGFTRSASAIPQELQDACVEAALDWLDGSKADLTPDVSTPTGDIKKESVQVGPIKIATEYVGSGGRETRRVKIGRLLAPIITSGYQVIRG